MVAWWVVLLIAWGAAFFGFLIGACINVGARADRMDAEGRKLRDRDETQRILRRTRGY